MIAAYILGQNVWVIPYSIYASNIVETPLTSDVGNNTRPLPNNLIAHNAFDTLYNALVDASFDTPSVYPITKQ